MKNKTVKLPSKAIEGCKQLLLGRNMVEARLQAYLQGITDALGLEGKWNLNTDSWEFTKGEVKKDG